MYIFELWKITFVQTLLSHRYGARPVRTRIPEAHMNLFIDELKQRSQEDLDFLMAWYQRDENAIPPDYILKVNFAIPRNAQLKFPQTAHSLGLLVDVSFTCLVMHNLHFGFCQTSYCRTSEL